MRPTLLVAGREYQSRGAFTSAYPYTFVRRERQPCRAAINIFRCEAFRGLNGPTDDGTVHMTDYEVSRKIIPMPLCDCGEEGCNACAAYEQLTGGAK